MSNFIDVFQERQDEVFHQLLTHIEISITVLLIACVLSIPLAIYATKHPRLAEWVIGVASVIQTIPSMAMLGLLIPLVGIGKLPAVIALVLYALLPIIRNTYTGIREIDPAYIEAADAMGMNSWQRLMRVELPLAYPVIMAGIRTATVLIIGTATLAALVGGGGLGELILLGIDRNDTALILLGAIPAALLAIVFDFGLRRLEGVSFRKSLRIVMTTACVFALLFTYIFFQQDEDADIVIAGKLGSEPEILIQMYKQLIEEETDLTVEIKPGFGKTSFVFNALESGEIDLYPEFTGTIVSTFLKETPVSTDAEEVYTQAKTGIEASYPVQYLDPMQYNNTYVLAVRKDTAERYGLETMSDLIPVASQLKAGFTLEFADREDGYVGIEDTYGIQFSSVATLEPKLRYQAIANGDVDVIDAYSTDSELEELGLVVLEDDKNFFPPYQGAPLVRTETLEEYPELEPVLNELSGQITDEEMREMNYAVNVEGKSSEAVAEEYLTSHGLLD